MAERITTNRISSSKIKTMATHNNKNYLRDKNNILGTAKTMVALSDDFLNIKRRQIFDRYELYRRDVRDVRSRNIKDNTVFRVIDLFSAVDYHEKPSVGFEPKTESLEDKRIADYLTQLAQNDEQEGGYFIERQKANFQKYFTGIGVRYLTSWNIYKQLPIWKSIPTVNLILDPEGGNDVDSHRFIGFRMRYNINSMKGDDWFMEEVEKARTAQRDIYTQEADAEIKRVVGLNQNQEATSETAIQRQTDTRLNKKTRNKLTQQITSAGGMIDVYDIFFRGSFGDDKEICTYMATTTQNGENLLRLKKLKPVGKEERENEALIKFPVVFDRFTPAIPGDPIGTSVFDLTEDKQINQSILLNLVTDIGIKNLDAIMVVRDVVDMNDTLPNSDKIITLPTNPEGVPNEPIDHLAGFLPKQDVNQNEVVSTLSMLREQVELDICRAPAGALQISRCRSGRGNIGTGTVHPIQRTGTTPTKAQGRATG